MSTTSQCVTACVEPFLDGASSRSESEVTLSVTDPSNGQSFLTISAGCERDVDRAVMSARRAFCEGGWSNASPTFRAEVLYRVADLISENAAALDVFDAGEMGKPVQEAFNNARAAANLLRFYAGAADKVTGDVYNTDKSSFAVQRRIPRGVVAAVVPWNFPTHNAVMKIAPALAAGNCVVLKPSELASRSAVYLAQMALQAGLPPGVFNVVPGAGEVVGRGLGLHQDVDMLAFTGSTAVGKKMLQYAGQSNMKVVLAECGGKSPHIVFADGMDLEAVAEHIARMLVTNQGQICSVGSRLLVERSIESQLIERIVRRVRDVAVGAALDAKTTFGPLASEQQCARVMRYIEVGQAQGATIVAGGNRALPDSGGYFVEPTIFRNVAPTARIAQEEIFGPVLSVIAFDDEGEAIRIANGTMYGLMAYVWTTDLSRTMRLVKGIRSGLLVNAVPPMGDGPGDAISWEPAGQSGVGTEGGLPGMESYMRRQFVWINHA
jgi:acyl-CoA reductase-like NAD-dependent aldehyde dehydrogenase